jgi:hypothetical protein
LWEAGPVVPADFNDFFAAIAAVSGALIGLLFVAISLSPERTVGAAATAVAKATAGLAFIAFTNTLVVSLLALIPGEHFGVVVMAVWSISGTLALSAQIFLHRRAQAPGWRWVVLSVTSLLVFGVQLARGIQLMVTPDDRSAVTSIAVLGVVLSAIGIARAWELLGAKTPGLIGDFRRWRSSRR